MTQLILMRHWMRTPMLGIAALKLLTLCKIRDLTNLGEGFGSPLFFVINSIRHRRITYGIHYYQYIFSTRYFY
jgi:hypothetical protein